MSERALFEDFSNPAKPGECMGAALMPELRTIYTQVLENKNDLKWVKGLMAAVSVASLATLLTALSSLLTGGT